MSECDINQLSSDAACFSCLDPKTRDSMQTELLCQILGSLSGGVSIGEVTQGTTPWIVSGEVSIAEGSLCVTQCTSPWVVSGEVVVGFLRETNARNVYGSVDTVGSGDTDVVINISGTQEGYKITGFEATGTTDAYFWVEIDGSKRYFGTINESNKTFHISLPNPDPLSEGSTIQLIVRNDGGVNGDFEATLTGILSLGGNDPELGDLIVDGDGAFLLDGDTANLVE